MRRYLPPLSEAGVRWARFLGLVAAVFLLAWTALALRPVLTPIAAGLAIAYILNPVVTWLEAEHRVSRVVSAAVGLLLLVGLGALVLIVATAQVTQFAANIPEYVATLRGWFEQSPFVQADTSSLTDLAREHGVQVSSTIMSGFGRFIGDAMYWLSLTVLLPMYTFFFVVEFNRMKAAVRDHLPADSRDTIVDVAMTIDRAVSDFFRGRVIVCLVVGLLNGFGWLIVGVPYNLALGALAGVLNLVPFLSVMALPPVLILSYLEAQQQDENWVIMLGLALGVFVVVQAIESFVLTPVIESRSSGLHPITTVIALLIGGQVAGLLGMLLSIPIASTLKSLGGKYLMPEVRRLAEERSLGPPTAPADGQRDDTGPPAEPKP